MPCDQKTGRAPASGQTKKIFIGVDGLGRETFDYAREHLGYFKIFKNVSTHIAPFPSISDYSWNIMTHSQEVHGKKGSIRSYEASYFNRDKNRLSTDPREYFRRLGHHHLYFNGAFEHYLNPYIESLLYIPTEELPRLELKQLKESILADTKDLVTVMVASNDALAHTRANSQEFLKDLDKFIIDIDQHYRQQGIEAEIIIVSDHGQTGRFRPEEAAIKLLPIQLAPLLKNAGLKLSASLKTNNDIVIPIMALANYGTAYVKDKSARDRLIEQLQQQSWFTLALFRENGTDDNEVKVSLFDTKGKASLIIKRNRDDYSFIYNSEGANPLQLPESAFDRELEASEAHELSMKTVFPDSLYRIAFSVFQEECDFPDLIFTVKDDYYIEGDLSSLTTMFQTHGSLSKRSSFGVVASTMGEELASTPVLRTKQILGTLGITPPSLFRIKEEGWFSKPENSLSQIADSAYEGIITNSEDFTNRRVFELMNKAVHYSQYSFDAPTMSTIVEVVKPFAGKSPATAKTNESDDMDLSKIDIQSIVSLNDLAKIVDIMIKTGDIEEVKKDPVFIKIKEKIAKYQEVRKKSSKQTASGIHEHGAGALEEIKPYTDAAKKVVMKAYSTTFFLEKAFELPEFATIVDERDIQFRRDWEVARSQVIQELFTEDSNKTAQKLFSEIFKERQILSDIAPATMPLLYNRGLKKFDNTTIVYLSGIYNSIFDNEIFQMGLDNLVNQMGIRVIAPPVLSSCSSEYNAKVILDFLKADQEKQVAIGHARPKYLILGYSKGGMDALHAFAKEPAFIQENVQGLVAIATPIKGTTILNKTDLPFELEYLLGSEEIPEICKSTQKASLSITPEGAHAFLRKESSKLIGLTRYYSASFVEDIKNSHLFMKLTKDIARFGEPNDGVVNLSSSKFPAEFQAVDLGIIKADHLAGIVASHFPQEAFLEAIVLTMGELDALYEKNNARYNQFARYHAKSTPLSDHKTQLSIGFGQDFEEIFSDKKMSKRELKEIQDRIEQRLKGTPYELNDFNLVKNNKGEVTIVFAKPLFNNSKLMSFIQTKEKVQVENIDAVMEVLLEKLQASGKNLLKGGMSLLPLIPISGRPPFKVPANQLGYFEDLRINLRQLGDFISGKKVTPLTRASHPQGINIVYDHRSSVEFRKEYELSFESTAPLDTDDNAVSGWIANIDKENKVSAKLASKGTSIRLTTYSMRFLASEFPELTIDIQVNNDVENANVLFGGTGKDDSAFQLWFTFRVINNQTNRTLLNTNETMRTLGYYFGDTIVGKDLKVNEIYENYYSKKNFIVATLPEAKIKLIGFGKDMMGIPLITKHNLIEDLKIAYPDVNPEQIEILAMTIQHDSNDTKGDSEALFRSVKFQPVK